MVYLMMEGRGEMPGSWSQKDGALGVDTVLAASEQSARVEPSWEVSWILFKLAWWDIGVLRPGGKKRLCALLCLRLGVLILDDSRQGG